MKVKKQAFNPYLPSYEYIPDGEPHVFDGRVYIYGSHDRFDGAHFCLNDYVSYSADIHNLSDWRYEGIIFKKDQDPRNQHIPENTPEPVTGMGVIYTLSDQLNEKGIHAMWAPDVVQGLDGRYYLYYCLDFLPEIAVAVCDKPAGKYEFLGFVQYPDKIPLGKKEGDYIQFDPGIFVDDDQSIYLYSGNAPMYRGVPRRNNCSQVMKLEKDMMTLKESPRLLLPDIYSCRGTDFEGHEFFEASSIRKIHGKYYFIYSSVNSHELCYAVSDKPDEGYCFGGTIIDIGDIYLEGRTKKYAVNCLGNTHGGIEKINNEWYVFYHRQTHRTNFSRQGCAEKISISLDGSIAQVPITSCGLNDGPLRGTGVYPAYICCHLTGKKGVAYSHPSTMKMHYPFLTQDLRDVEPGSVEAELEGSIPAQYIKNIKDRTVIGYKYFDFNGVKKLTLKLRGRSKGKFFITTSLESQIYGHVIANIDSTEWVNVCGDITVPDGVQSLYLSYEGKGILDFLSFELED